MLPWFTVVKSCFQVSLDSFFVMNQRESLNCHPHLTSVKSWCPQIKPHGIAVNRRMQLRVVIILRNCGCEFVLNAKAFNELVFFLIWAILTEWRNPGNHRKIRESDFIECVIYSVYSKNWMSKYIYALLVDGFSEEKKGKIEAQNWHWNWSYLSYQ